MIEAKTLKFGNGETLKLVDADAREMLDTKAEIDGAYDGMTVGNAEQIVSNLRIKDNAPYLFRTAGGNAEIGDRAYINKLVGGSLVVNQLLKPLTSDFWARSTSTVTVTFADEIASLTASARYDGIRSNKINTIANHRYLIVFDMYSDSAFTLRINFTQPGYTSTFNNTVTGAWATKKLLKTFSSDSPNQIYIQDCRESDWTEFKVKNVMFIDLTQMFGSTIADYIYSLEQANAGDGVAWFRKYFPDEYYPYNAGEIQSVQTSEHKTVGFNQWDEEWEVGGYDIIGKKQAYTDRIRSKNMIKVLPNTVYAKNNIGMYVCEYDSEQNFIRRAEWATTKANFTTSENTRFITFNTYSSYGTVYKDDICINLSWDGERDGEYEPYQQHTYPLSEIELRGIAKLDDGNNLLYDGDIYRSDGTVTRNYEIIDLQTLTWTRRTTTQASNVFSATLPSNGINNVYVNAENYYRTNTNFSINFRTGYATTLEGEIAIYRSGSGGSDTGTNTVYLRPLDSDGVSTLNDLASWFTTHPVQLLYTLATPTTEQAEPFQSPMVVDNWGTEEFVDERDWAIPVGHETEYPQDLRAKLEASAPNPASDGVYLLQYANNEATYTPLASNNVIANILSRLSALESEEVE